MNYTEKKHCDKCNKITSHLIEEDNPCLLCAWKDNDDFWEEVSKKPNFEEEKAKGERTWRKAQNNEKNKEIISELMPEEKVEYEKVKERRNKLFYGSSENAPNNKGLGWGWIALIAILVLLVVGGIGYLLWKNKKNDNNN